MKIQVIHDANANKSGVVYSRHYKIKPSTHWSETITVYFYANRYNAGPGVDASWSSGGVNEGVTIQEVAEAMAAAWTITKAIIDHHTTSAEPWPIPEENQ